MCRVRDLVLDFQGEAAEEQPGTGISRSRSSVRVGIQKPGYNEMKYDRHHGRVHSLQLGLKPRLGTKTLSESKAHPPQVDCTEQRLHFGAMSSSSVMARLPASGPRSKPQKLSKTGDVAGVLRHLLSVA